MGYRYSSANSPGELAAPPGPATGEEVGPEAAADVKPRNPRWPWESLVAFLTSRKYGFPLFSATVVFFLVWPDFDLEISRFFFSSEIGGFLWKDSVIANEIYTLTHVVAAGTFILLLVLIAASYVLRSKLLARRRMALFFLLSAAIVGPGLMVNVGLKDHWGRPRPHQVVEFGGQEQYHPPLSPDFEHQRYHSFVSGHASIGFYFFGLALLSRSRRLLWLPAIAGAAIGLTRIGQGGHFFSDVVFSGWVVWYSTILLYALFCRISRVRQAS